MDLYGMTLFLLIGAISVLRYRLHSDHTLVYGPAVFALSVMGVAGIVWCLVQLNLRWHLFVPRYWAAAFAMIFVFAVSATDLSRARQQFWRQILRTGYRSIISPESWAAAALLVAILLLAQRGGRAMPTDPSIPTGAAFLKWFASQPIQSEFRTAATKGEVEVVKFNDYQCPACRRTAEEYGSSIARLTVASNGAVRFKEMDFPLETECNPFARADVHPAACESAVAVRLAREHGTERAMIDWLWTNQAALTAARVREAAHRVASLNDYDLRYEELLKRVRDDVTIGNRVGVAGTPTFFVNGRKLTVVRPADFEAAIRYELGWRVQ